MSDSEITTTILRQIRDEIVKTRTELASGLQQVNARIDATNERLDLNNEQLAVVEHTVRDAAQQIVMIGRYVKNKQDVAIEDLRKRISRLEKKVG